jgi:hypothetical protein
LLDCDYEFISGKKLAERKGDGHRAGLVYTFSIIIKHGSTFEFRNIFACYVLWGT